MDTRHEIEIMHPYYGRVCSLETFEALCRFAANWAENYNEDIMLNWTHVNGKKFSSWNNLKNYLTK